MLIVRVGGSVILAGIFLFCTGWAQGQQVEKAPTHADILRGAYGEYRANNDLLSYSLDIRVDPAVKKLSGKNTIRFRMLKSATRIQIDLYENLRVEKILLAGQ